jgi:hypothetical protein
MLWHIGTVEKTEAMMARYLIFAAVFWIIFGLCIMYWPQ